MKKSLYLSAQEAASTLEVSLGTLYSYVSRGLIRSEATEGKARTRRYLAQDIETLQKRKAQRRNPAIAAESALYFGDAVLESAITLIDHGRLYYRGHDALQLAQEQTFEEVVALLWRGKADAASLFTETDQEDAFSARVQKVAKALVDLPPVEAFQVLLPLVAVDDLAAYNLAETAVQQTGVRLLKLFAHTITDTHSHQPLAQRLQQLWSPNDKGATRLLNAALILSADHELNVSAFTARCVASAESTPYAAVQAGLAALRGFKHGGDTTRSETLLRDAAALTPHAAIAHRLQRGEGIPGFGHPLYPEGDPRGRCLIQLVAEHYPNSSTTGLIQGLVTEVAQNTQQQPNLDFGLVAVAQVLALPPGSPLTLFALGRTAGWIGHTLEQYARGQMIRPRASYMGVQPHVDTTPNTGRED